MSHEYESLMIHFSDRFREGLVEAQKWPVRHMDMFPDLHAHGDPKSHDHHGHDHGHDHHFKPQRAPTTKRTTTTKASFILDGRKIALSR